MGGHWQLIWFGLGLTGLGAAAAFLFWAPWSVEQDDDYTIFGSRVLTHRIILVVSGLLIAVIGLAVVIRHAFKLLLP